MAIIFAIAAFTQVKGQSEYKLLYLQNQWDSIIHKAKTNTKADEATANDYYWYAIALNETGNIQECISILNNGLQDFPDNSEMNHLLAGIYFKNGNYAKAMPILEKYQKDTESRIKRAKIYEFRDNYPKAITIFRKLYRADTANIMYLKHLGNDYYKTDSVAKAISFFRKVLHYNQHDQPVAYKLSRIYLKSGEHKKALEICKPILKNDSTNLKFLNQAGYVYYKWKKYSSASDIFSKALSLGDSSAFVFKHLGISEIASRSFKKGRNHLLKAYKRDSTDFKTCFFLGRAYLSSMYKEKGLYYLEKADSILQPSPSVLAMVHQEKASIYSELKQYNSALQMHEKSYRLTQNPKYLFHIASLYQNRKDDKQKALNYYRKFLEQLPEKQDSEDKKNKKGINISLKKVAKKNVKTLKEDLFFEGKTPKNE